MTTTPRPASRYSSKRRTLRHEDLLWLWLGATVSRRARATGVPTMQDKTKARRHDQPLPVREAAMKVADVDVKKLKPWRPAPHEDHGEAGDHGRRASAPPARRSRGAASPP